MKKSLFSFVGLVLAAVFGLTACSQSADSGSGDGTVSAGKLTIATGEPAYGPWVQDDKPESGEGFEAAVAYAVAKELGYDRDSVVWVRTSFEAAIAPGPKDFDLNLQQFSIDADRAKAVDFSTPYYVTTQAVVAREGSVVAGAKSLAELRGARIGVASGTTSLRAAEKVVRDKADLQVFNSVEDTVAALKSGTVDALVTDLPGAFYVRDAQLDDGVIVGQLGDSADGDEFGIVLPKGSKLTSRVSDAVDKLRGEGVFDELAAKWITAQGAPVLN